MSADGGGRAGDAGSGRARSRGAADPGPDPEAFWRRLAGALEQPGEGDRPPATARAGAVLVLLEDTEAGPRLVLTRRRRDLRSHPGQVSFPGGRLDPEESLEEAALREAAEEIGLEPDSVDVLGTGPRFYIAPSRFWVVPVVARWRRPHPLDPNPWEVDEILPVPLATLLDRRRWRRVPLARGEGDAWAWELDRDLLWGATALVVARVLDVAVAGWSGGLRPDDLGPDRVVRPWESDPPPASPARLRGELPSLPEEEVVHVTAAQMRSVDERLAAAGVPLASLVEHAGRAVTEAVRRLGGPGLAGAGVTVLAGPGGNGAGGLAAARLLDAAGARVRVVLAGDARLGAQVETLRAAGVAVTRLEGDEAGPGLSSGEVVVDALLGYGVDPPLRGAPAAAVAWLRRHDVPVVALDLPSGLGADGVLEGPCVTADVTVTLAAPKVGLRPPAVRPYVGDLYLADIGVPRSVWRDLGLEPPQFGRGPLVRLLPADGPAPPD